jgi:hypothetical protein
VYSAWGWTPLQTLYSVECLENRTRAKGSGANFLFLNIAMVVNTYGIAVGIEAIGWKLYLVYIGWIVVEVSPFNQNMLGITADVIRSRCL